MLLVGKPKKGPLARPTHRWEDINNTDITQIWCDGLIWLRIRPSGRLLWARSWKFRIHNMGNFSTIWERLTSSRRTVRSHSRACHHDWQQVARALGLLPLRCSWGLSVLPMRFDPWRWDHHAVSKRRGQISKRRGTTSQKNGQLRSTHRCTQRGREVIAASSASQNGV